MARGNQNINDQLFRTSGRNAAESRESQEDIRKCLGQKGNERERR